MMASPERIAAVIRAAGELLETIADLLDDEKEENE